MFYSAFARARGFSAEAVLYLPSNPCEKFAKPVMLLVLVERNERSLVPAERNVRGMVPVEKNARGGKKLGRWVRVDGALREMPVERECAC